MKCKQCGEENGDAKRICSRCGAFLEGYTLNNVTGEYGYRGADGGWYKSEEENLAHCSGATHSDAIDTAKVGKVSFSIRDEDNYIWKWFNGIMMDFKRKKKAMSYAVTHGYTIRIICDVDGVEGYFEIDKPRDVNLLFRKVPFVPRMKIVKDGCFYNIKKGRIVPMMVCPVAEDMIKMYEKKFNKENL